MTWNYRILAKKINNDIEYAIYEVHYENDIPVGFTTNHMLPIYFGSYEEDPIKSIKWQLNAMKIAAKKPILDYDNFPNEFSTYYRRKKLEYINKLLKK